MLNFNPYVGTSAESHVIRMNECLTTLIDAGRPRHPIQNMEISLVHITLLYGGGPWARSGMDSQAAGKIAIISLGGTGDSAE